MLVADRIVIKAARESHLLPAVILHGDDQKFWQKTAQELWDKIKVAADEKGVDYEEAENQAALHLALIALEGIERVAKKRGQ
jgi:hypothetical protein